MCVSRVCGRFFREFSAERMRWVVNLRGRQAGAQGGPLQSDSLASKQQHGSGPTTHFKTVFSTADKDGGMHLSAGYHLTDVKPTDRLSPPHLQVFPSGCDLNQAGFC